MKTVRLLIVCLLSIFCWESLIAQNVKVTGNVSDAQNGDPLVGVFVQIKGTTDGTMTDEKGNYHISCPSDAVLFFSYVGYGAEEVPVNGKTVVNVKLRITNILDELVVTGMGMTRSQKSVGYATTTVKSEDLTQAKSSQLMSGIQGKVAGVQVSSSGGTGTSQKVLVRGISSFSSNNPLYVIDGVPMSNNFQGENSFSASVDFGNGAGDINPDDVESMTILKGASATAIYGSRAANGVIMITTKRAQEGKITVTYDGSFIGSDVLRVPQGQDKFGQGWPFWDVMENGSWGPRLDGRNHTYGAWAGYEDDMPDGYVVRSKPFSFVKDNIRNFYKTGFEMNNNLSISAGNEVLGMVLSYGNTSSNGVLPENADTYNRNSFSLRANAKYKRFSIDANINYVAKNMRQPTAGQGDSGASTFQELLQYGADMAFTSFKDYNNLYNNPDNFYTAYAENPYWVLANNKNRYSDDRVFGKIEAELKAADWLKFTGRIGTDITNARIYRQNAKYHYLSGSWSKYNRKKALEGSYQEIYNRNDQLDVTLLATFNKDIAERWNLGVVLGYNYNERKYKDINANLSGGLSAAGWYSLENGADKPLTNSYRSDRRLQGIFAQADLSYNNWAYLTAVCRNDWSSTLPIDKNSFFYWGVNGAVILSEAIPSLKDSGVPFLKLRLAYGKTGNDAPIYRTAAKFVPGQFGLGFGSVYLPIGGIPGLTESNVIENKELKPEITTETEVGLTAHFLDNRITFDGAFYNKLTKDQIITATFAQETGYTTKTMNVGEIRNRGVELMANFTPIQTSDWKWDFGMTFTKNFSKVLKLWGNVNEYVMSSAYQVQYVAEVGKELGIYRVPAVEVDDKGRTIVKSNGLPLMSSSKKDEVGSSTPNFNMGFNTRLSWKNLSLSAVLDWRNGGYFYCYTAQLYHFSGNATPTVYNNRQPFIIPNSVVEVSKGVYEENTIPVRWATTYNYYNNGSNYDMYRTWILKKDYVKLRELVLSYDFPKSLMDKIKFVKNIRVSAIGRNLFMWTPKENNYVDPEATNYGNDIDSEFGEFAAAPTFRTFGGSIKITF